jgi:hypothetical protein
MSIGGTSNSLGTDWLFDISRWQPEVRETTISALKHWRSRLLDKAGDFIRPQLEDHELQQVAGKSAAPVTQDKTDRAGLGTCLRL